MPDVKAGKYEALLAAMRERWDYATDEWQDIRSEARMDMQYVSGNPWTPREREERRQAGRPCLSLDELAQYTNQLINDIRQHKRAIKVTPIGSGANDQTAELRADLMRQIEYRSNAQQAYTVGFENTVNRSYGFWKIHAKHVQTPKQSGGTGAGMNQELLIGTIPNPDNVTIDPDIVTPTGRDMQYAWESESWDYRTYRKKFPKARVQDFDASLAKTVGPQWMTNSRIQIAAYWTVESRKRNLMLFKGKGPAGSDLEVFEDEWQGPNSQYKALATYEPDDERDVEDPVVTRYLTNGFEVLEAPYRWPGQTIPIICCFGKILYIDDGSGAKRKILSAIRLARDPFKLYCYYRTTEAELVGMTPKVPYFVRRGSLKDDQKLLLQKSLHEPVAVIEVEGKSDSMPPGTPPEMPVRNPYDPAIQAMEMGAEGARRAIQAAMGISPLPTQAIRLNEKSGKALEAIHDSEQQGTFHFVDAYEMAIMETGSKLNEVLDVFYDSARDVTLRNGQDEARQVRINDPTAPGGMLWLGPGYDHDVTIGTGPSFDSQREEATDFSDTLVQNIGMVAQISGPQTAAKLLSLSVKLKTLGPIGDEIAELLAPPDPGQIDPQQAAQQMQALQSENQQLKMAAAVETAKHQATLQKAQMDNASRESIEVQKSQTDLQKAWIMVSAQLIMAAAKVGAENARSLAEALDKRDAGALGAHLDAMAHAVTASEAAKDRAHDVGLAMMEHQHTLEQAQQGQDHALEQGDQSHGQALEQNEQQAALAPEPEPAEPA